MTNYIKALTYKQLYFLGGVGLVIHFFLSKDLPFFWDGISKSLRADWIYSNGMTDFILPTEIGSGHPPLWIALLSIFWTILGKTLWASRLLLLIINFGIFYQIINLSKKLLHKNVHVILVLLVFLEPTISAQLTSLNNDMLLLFFTLLSLNAVLNNRAFLLGIALTGLLMTNLRGIYLVLAISLIHYIYVRLELIQSNKRMYVAYASAIIIFGIFCITHYNKLGWVIITPNEDYNVHRQSVSSLKNLGVNLIIYVRCFLEYGRFMLFIILLPLLIVYIKKYRKELLTRKEVALCAIPLVVYSLVLFLGMVPFSNPIANRYFMICFILAVLLLLNLLYVLKIKKKLAILSVVAIAFLSGHFWIYPPTISQSWDSALAYLSYYSVEEEIENYIADNALDRKTIGTRLKLNRRATSELRPHPVDLYYSKFDLNDNVYVMLSNIENRTKDDEFLEVSNNWEHIKTYSQLGVFISLYKKP